MLLKGFSNIFLVLVHLREENQFYSVQVKQVSYYA